MPCHAEDRWVTSMLLPQTERGRWCLLMLLQCQYANMLTWKAQKRDDLCCLDRCYDGRNVLQAATLGVVAGGAGPLPARNSPPVPHWLGDQPGDGFWAGRGEKR